MGVAVVSQRFCCVCGTGHSDPTACPGELRATGAERPGWRVEVETPVGRESIGVLLAPSYDQWRARIVTYPNVLWRAPGGRGAIKFIGITREDAELQAIQFIEAHLRAKRAGSSRPLLVAGQRKARRLPVRFGTDRAITRGMTLNVSPDGMFVHVATPLESGGSLLLHLELDGQTVPMRGLVMWIRRRAEADRPSGMGIRLANPPRFYQSFVAALA
jgi:hypothetical protein